MKRIHFTHLLVAAAVFAFAAQSFAQTDVADIAALRASAADNATIYRITGTVVVTSAPNTTGNGQTVIQDASGTDGQSAVLIYDAGNTYLGTSLVIGDQIQNLTGKLTTYHGYLEFTPTVAATSSGSTTPPTPLVVTSANTDGTAIESELIRANAVSVSATGNWAASTNYTLTSAVGVISVLRIGSGSALAGTPIPTGSFDLIGIAVIYDGTGQIMPRILSDQITGPSTDDPDAVLNKGALDYGYLNVSSTRDLTVTITNAAASSQNLVISSPGFNITGGNAGQFAIVGSPTFPITLAAGESTSLTLEITTGGSLGVSYSATATLTSNDPNNPSMSLTGGTADQVVANLSELRALGSTGSKVLVSGTCVVVAGRNQVGSSQLYVQDASGTDGQTAIQIYDLSNLLGRTYVIGDQVQNLCGTLTQYYNMLEYVPVGLADFTGTTTPPDPLVITSSITDFETIEGELIQVNSAVVDNAGDTTFGVFTYNIASPTNLVINRVQIAAGSGALGETIPLMANYIGIAYDYSDTPTIDKRILPRIAGDLVIPPPPLATDGNWALYQ